MVLAITSFYREHGYFLAQAYLPQQDILHGEVSIAVLEGRIGEIKIDNQSRMADSVTGLNVKELKANDLVHINSLERQVLLLNDLPGINAKSLLSPGQQIVTTDLTLAMEKTATVSGSVAVDNTGDLYTGSNRRSTTVNLNEPFRIGDVASIYALKSLSGLNFVRASYQVQLAAWKFGVAYTNMNYTLGDSFAALGASGTMNDA